MASLIIGPAIAEMIKTSAAAPAAKKTQAFLPQRRFWLATNRFVNAPPHALVPTRRADAATSLAAQRQLGENRGRMEPTDIAVRPCERGRTACSPRTLMRTHSGTMPKVRQLLLALRDHHRSPRDTVRQLVSASVACACMAG